MPVPAPSARLSHPLRSPWLTKLLVPWLLVLVGLAVIDWDRRPRRPLHATYDLDNYWMEWQLADASARDTAIVQRDTLIHQLRRKLRQRGLSAAHPPIGAARYERAHDWAASGLPRRLDDFLLAYPRICRLVITNTSRHALTKVQVLVPQRVYYEFTPPRQAPRAGFADARILVDTLAAGATCPVQLWLPPPASEAADWATVGVPGLRVAWAGGQLDAQLASFLSGSVRWLYWNYQLLYLLFFYGLAVFWHLVVRPWRRARLSQPPLPAAAQHPPASS